MKKNYANFNYWVKSYIRKRLRQNLSFFLILFLLSSISTLLDAQKLMENLNRGVLAVRTGTSSVLVSWRILGPEYETASYNIYRDGTLLNESPITDSGNYIDATSNDGSYQVAAVINGEEQELSAAVDVWDTFYKSIPLTPPDGGTTPDDETYTYEANDASVGDLDGDGDYEIVLKWMPTNSQDNSKSGYTGSTILQALEFDGTILWTIDLGINIRSGAHYTQFMVYDLDCDGKAEVACKTADGSMDGKGNVIGDSSADYRNSSGYILSGPEYLTVFSGETGEAMATEDYIPARGTVSSWGDSYGNRVDRFLAGVAYLDGEKPSLVFSRGYYTRIVVAAWDYSNGTLSNRWTFDSSDVSYKVNGNSIYAGQGNHNLAIGDLDQDGYDEIQFGSMAIDDDGTGLYTTQYGHGDAAHLGDLNPNREGLEFFDCHEEADGDEIPALDFRDPSDGTILWEISGAGDFGRCLAADIDSNYVGAECWGSDGSGVYSCTGELISTTYPLTAGNGVTYNMAAWYDGDLLRELVDRTVITKWNSSTHGTDRVLTAYNYGATANNSTKSNPCLIADVLGDWREEIIWRNSSSTALLVFASTEKTEHRIFTLMHDPLYRESIAWQNVGYNQPAHTGFYLGHGMTTPSAPDIALVTSSSTSTSINEANRNTNDELLLFPNPNNESLLNIETSLNQTSDVRIFIYGNSGHLIKKYVLNNQSSGTFNNSVSVSDLIPGVYYVQFITNTHSKTARFIRTY